MAQSHSFQMIAEMKDFAAFSAAEQRYIRRSLDVVRKGIDAEEVWSRNATETDSIRAQARLYRTLLEPIRGSIPDDIAVDAAAEFMGSLMNLSAFDLGEGKLLSFAAFRFLYERLLGGSVRPCLPSGMFKQLRCRVFTQRCARRCSARSRREKQLQTVG
jgi:hypothetical protein